MALLEEAFISNIIIILCIHYVGITFNNNSAVINNNYGRHQGFILVFKVTPVKRKDYFGIYGQFGHAPTKRFARPDLGNTVQF
jgi:hypothetical protein